MPKSRVTAIAAAIALAVGSAAATTTAVAQEKPSVSKGAAKTLKAAQDALVANNYDEVLAKTAEAKGVSGLSSYDKYVIAQFETQAYARKGNLGEAAKAMEAQLETGFGTPAEKVQIQKGLSSIAYQQKNYAKAADMGQQVIAAGGADAETYTVVAQSYFLQNKYDDTIKFLGDYVGDQEKKGQQPKEQTLQLMSESYSKKGDTNGATASLEKLVAYYPKPIYWNNLLYTMMRAEGNTDVVTLNIYRLMLDTGTLKQPSDFTEMAQLAIERGTPCEAKKVLERGAAENVFVEQRDKERNQRLLESSTKLCQQDQAGIGKFATEAQAAKSGEGDVRLGQAYLSFDQADKAVEPIQRGITKGSLKSNEEAQILLGMAQLKQKKVDDAVKSFKSVKGDPKWTRLANLWALHAKA